MKSVLIDRIASLGFGILGAITFDTVGIEFNFGTAFGSLLFIIAGGFLGISLMRTGKPTN